MSLDEKVFKAALVDLSTGETKKFQYNPESWTDERSINWASITIPGISYPRQQFVAGGDTIIHFKLFLNALNHPKGGQGILNDVYWVRNRTYPKKSGNILKVPPTRVMFVWPGMYSTTGIITSANLEYTSFFSDGRLKYGTMSIEIKKNQVK